MTTTEKVVYPLRVFHGIYPDGRVTDIWCPREGAALTLKLKDADGNTTTSPFTYRALVDAQLDAGHFWDDMNARKNDEESAGDLPVDHAPIAELKGLA